MLNDLVVLFSEMFLNLSFSFIVRRLFHTEYVEFFLFIHLYFNLLTNTLMYLYRFIVCMSVSVYL